MSYQTTVNAIRAAAEAVNPNGTFTHGRRVDASQKSIQTNFPLIHLFPININKASGAEFIDTSTILIGFFQQDRPDTSMEEREAIIAEMDMLCSSFLTELEANKKISVASVVAEPQYQMFSGTVSGFAIRFNLQDFTPC